MNAAEREARAREWQWHLDGTGPSTWPMGPVREWTPRMVSAEQAAEELEAYRRKYSE